MTLAEIDRRFDHHPPDEETGKRHAEARARVKALAVELNDRLPECRETSLVFTNLEQALFWANAAIARESQEKEP